MNKPTGEQWRGYLWLSIVLLAVLLVLILMPRRRQAPPPSDHSQLERVVALYSDSMEREAEQQRQRYLARYRQHYRRQRPDFGYDTSYRRFRHYERSFAPRSPIELNNADTADLQRIYGIGPTFAQRIVRYRTQLGGYVRKEQLREVFGMTEERYQAVAPQVEVDSRAARKIDINHATLYELRSHPYLDYYQARAIMEWRQKGNLIGNLSDLGKVNLMDDSTLQRLEDYLLYDTTGAPSPEEE